MPHIDQPPVSPLADKVVLVTGGTGSFGQVMLRRLLTLGPREIRVFSRDEEKQWLTAHALGVNEIGTAGEGVRFFVGDVRDRRSIDHAMAGTEIVLNAAALKQVPRCEHFVYEAVQTNILGAQSVIDSAVYHGVEMVLMISTDKAAKPINAMGMTKAVQEKLAVSAAWNVQQSGTRVACVRYGNVLSSRGSVVPLFQSQIKTGKALTVTDPEMTRFLLTLDDAVDLVLFATATTRGGEIFVHNAPAATVATLAEAVLSQAGVDAKIQIVGSRPGEKKHEVLVTEEEATRTKRVGGEYFAILPPLPMPHTHAAYMAEEDVAFHEFSSNSTRQLDRDEVVGLLNRVAPIKM